MTLHVLVEGTSERAFLEPWSRRLLPGHPIRVHPHQGKGSLPIAAAARPEPHRRGLLDQLPAKLRAFASSLDPEKDRVVVLIDADDEEPAELIARIEKSVSAVGSPVTVLVRVAVEETEAFYLGDLKALSAAFPQADLKAAREYTPDSICGT